MFLTASLTRCELSAIMPRPVTPPRKPTALSEALAQAREAAALTLLHVGSILGVHHRTVRRWERGETAPSEDHLGRLATLYRTTPSALLVGSRRAA